MKIINPHPDANYRAVVAAVDFLRAMGMPDNVHEVVHIINVCSTRPIEKDEIHTHFNDLNDMEAIRA